MNCILLYTIRWLGKWKCLHSGGYQLHGVGFVSREGKSDGGPKRTEPAMAGTQYDVRNVHRSVKYKNTTSDELAVSGKCGGLDSSLASSSDSSPHPRNSHPHPYSDYPTPSVSANAIEKRQKLSGLRSDSRLHFLQVEPHRFFRGYGHNTGAPG